MLRPEKPPKAKLPKRQTEGGFYGADVHSVPDTIRSVLWSTDFKLCERGEIALKKLILMRHSIPEQIKKKTEDISLSKEGIALVKSKCNSFQNISKCYSSPYKRAIETASLIADRVIAADELKERIIGDAQEDFRLKQYQDYDFHNPDGESLNEVRIRMKAAIDAIVADMNEDETVLVVSHAAAICSYLLNYCEIEVTNAADKSRKITFAGQPILNGRFEPADYFEIGFENDIFSGLRFCKQIREK